MSVLTEIDKAIIEKVKKMRKKRGLSQSQLSFELELSNSLVSKVESGKYGKKYNIDQLNKIAKVLDCSLHSLIPKDPI